MAFILLSRVNKSRSIFGVASIYSHYILHCAINLQDTN